MKCGVSNHIRFVAERLADKFDVHILTSCHNSIDVNIAQNYRVYPIIKSWKLSNYHHICSEIIKFNPDIVHIQNPTAQYTGFNSLLMSLVASRLKKLQPHIRIVAMQHDIAIGRPLLRWRYWPLFNACDAITVSNQRDKQAIIKLKINPNKIIISPITAHFQLEPSSKEQINQARIEFGITKNTLCISYFGFIHPGRHIDLILKALSKIQQQGQPVAAIIMGAPGPKSQNYYKKCQKIAKKHQIKAIFTGFVDDKKLESGLACSDVFISLPDRGADMRNTSIHTAMLAGVPVVTFENYKYLIDNDLKNTGCVCIDKLEIDLLTQAILQAKDMPDEILQKARNLVLPEKVWKAHIEANIKAFLG